MSKGMSSYDHQELQVFDDVEVIDKSELIVYNDDHNTFDWVIESFVEVCGHTLEQAEQLSLIVHYKGKATVKTGAYPELKPLKDELINRGLSAVIESYQEKH